MSDESGVPGEAEGVSEDTPTLEARLRRLEEILSRLEADEVDLERALELFEEGVRHVREAERILARTELRVEELLGNQSTRPFEEDEG